MGHRANLILGGPGGYELHYATLAEEFRPGYAKDRDGVDETLARVADHQPRLDRRCRSAIVASTSRLLGDMGDRPAFDPTRHQPPDFVNSMK